MNSNPEKLSASVLEKKDSISNLPRLYGEVLEASELETLFGIQIGNKLNFENHIKSLCSKAS